MTDAAPGTRPALAALDIGTNSIHLVVARPVDGDRFETLTRERQVVRLGSGGGDMKLLGDEALERGLACIARMKGIADSYDAVLRAVATSATREAVNSRVLIDRAAAESNVHIDVISGIEEARLIHLGVLQAVPVFDRRLLLVDVGGGSTELLIGECGETLAVRSLKLGAVRLTDRFFPGGTATTKDVKACRSYVRSVIEHFRREVAALGFEVAVASSGTAETIAKMVHAAAGAEPLRTYNCAEVTAAELEAVVAELVGHRTPEARAKLRGLDPNRADIIVAGALILAAVVDTFGVESFLYSEAALREGVLLDTMSRMGGRHGAPPSGRQHSAAGTQQHSAAGTQQHAHGTALHHLRDVSRRSIRQLVDRCDDDPAHSIHVAGLAVRLFDAIAELRRLGPSAREYLEAGALLANVGLVVAHSQHHLHAYYVIRNSELAGLTDNEIEVIAQIARYHRKSEPKPSHEAFAALSAEDRRLVRSLAGVLRVAIGLDRRHDGRVVEVRVEDGEDVVRVVAVAADGDDIGLELFAAGERTALLERVLGRGVEVVGER